MCWCQKSMRTAKLIPTCPLSRCSAGGRTTPFECTMRNNTTGSAGVTRHILSQIGYVGRGERVVIIDKCRPWCCHVTHCHERMPRESRLACERVVRFIRCWQHVAVVRHTIMSSNVLHFPVFGVGNSVHFPAGGPGHSTTAGGVQCTARPHGTPHMRGGCILEGIVLASCQYYF